MSIVTVESYINEHKDIKNKLAGSQHNWLQAARDNALQSFAKLGYPDKKVENWKYTRVTPIAKQHLPILLTHSEHYEKNKVVSLVKAMPDCHCMVFINGYFSTELSLLSGLPDNVIVCDFLTATEQHSELLKKHLQQDAATSDSFLAFNTAFMHCGAFIHVPANTQIEKPIQLLFICTPEANTHTINLRNVLIAETQSKVNFIENYLAITDDSYFVNTVSNLILEQNAHLTHIKLQNESRQAFHIGTVNAQQAADSHFHSHSFARGGALVRSDTNTSLNAAGAHCTMNGLFIAQGKQHIDHHTCIEHKHSHCSSREYYRGILAEQAHGVFNGRVVVAKDAQKTDAVQENKNLLLSDSAEIDTKPQLEIYADDVKCAHGATVGQLDKRALFYLQARGINIEQATKILTYAFAKEIIERIDFAPVREQCENLLLDTYKIDTTQEETHES